MKFKLLSARVLSMSIAALSLVACGGSGGGDVVIEPPQPSPVACNSQTQTWTVAENSCSAVVGQTASGASVSLTNNTSGRTGAASFTCTNGNFGAPAAGATCASTVVPPLTACNQQTLTWTVSGNSCSASASQTAVGASTVITNSTSGRAGTATFTCTAGSFGSPAAGASCAPVVCDGKSC